MTSTEWIAVAAAAPALGTLVLIVMTYARVRKMADQVAQLHHDLEGNNHGR